MKCMTLAENVLIGDLPSDVVFLVDEGKIIGFVVKSLLLKDRNAEASPAFSSLDALGKSVETNEKTSTYKSDIAKESTKNYVIRRFRADRWLDRMHILECLETGPCKTQDLGMKGTAKKLLYYDLHWLMQNNFVRKQETAQSNNAGVHINEYFIVEGALERFKKLSDV